MKDKLEGNWTCSSAIDTEAPAPDSINADEVATLVLEDGMIKGTDVLGGIYDGTYRLKDDHLTVALHLSATDSSSKSILLVERFPALLMLDGQYSGAEHFLMIGRVLGTTTKVALDCRRQK